MTSVKFLADKIGTVGFEISGHSSDNCDDTQGKLVCSAISSAAYMTANTISEIIGDTLEAEVEDAYMRIEVKNPSKSSRDVLEGLELHIKELKKQFNNRIKIITEV